MFQLKANKRLWSFNRLGAQGILDREKHKQQQHDDSRPLLALTTRYDSLLGWEEQRANEVTLDPCPRVLSTVVMGR